MSQFVPFQSCTGLIFIKSWPKFCFRISNKIQLQNLDQTSASIPWPKFNFKILTWVSSWTWFDEELRPGFEALALCQTSQLGLKEYLKRRKNIKTSQITKQINNICQSHLAWDKGRKNILSNYLWGQKSLETLFGAVRWLQLIKRPTDTDILSLIGLSEQMDTTRLFPFSWIID